MLAPLAVILLLFGWHYAQACASARPSVGSGRSSFLLFTTVNLTPCSLFVFTVERERFKPPIQRASMAACEARAAGRALPAVFLPAILLLLLPSATVLRRARATPVPVPVPV